MSADDAVAFWLVKRDRGAALEREPAFVAWLAASKDHAAAWERGVALWDGFEAGDDLLLEAMRRDALSARRPSPRLQQWGLAAACAALILVIGGIGWRTLAPAPASDGSGQLIAANAIPTFVTAVGAPSIFPLPDGGQVTLDTDSALAVDFSRGRRAVRLLRGQAFFSVIHDPDRPFTADVEGRTVIDLGTDFIARIDGQTVSVTLVKGSLAVSSADARQRETLTPGQKLEAAPGLSDHVTMVDLDQALAWRTGYLEFRDEPLDHAIAEMNRYGGSPAEVTDPSLRAVRVNGRFRTGNPTLFARALSELYPLRLVNRPDGGVDIDRR
jgi:transmembrane sensor